MLVSSIVEWKAMGQTVVASILAGVGITVVFAFAIYGATRFADLSRDERTAAAAAAGLLSALALLGTLVAVAFGLILVIGS